MYKMNWLIYSGFFTILMIEYGDEVNNQAKENFYFKMLYICMSVLSFVRRLDITIGIILLYYIVKYAVQPLVEPYLKRRIDSLKLEIK
tara:strand:- start:1388 stop:1651 length:264 start_codon:yes stop_codon:yes gene_type:complete